MSKKTKFSRRGHSLESLKDLILDEHQKKQRNNKLNFKIASLTLPKPDRANKKEKKGKWFLPLRPLSNTVDEIENFNLLVSRFVNGWYYNEKKEIKLSNGYKIKLHNFHACTNDFIEIFKERIEKIVKSISLENSHNYKNLDLKTDWRLIHGLGSASVLETGITLHHIYGIPYIPASSIKGMLRSYFNYLKQKGQIEETIIDNFLGSQKKMGDVFFYDAFPISIPKIAIDIMNPHYSKYYSSEGSDYPPGDWLDPVPVNFLTIQDTTFRFYFSSKNDETLNKIIKSFEEAVKIYGIGAKTSVGYGFFKEVD